MWKFEKSATGPDNYLDHRQYEVCFLGRSNVGKSTLINALAGAKVARVSSSPGRTRTINFYSDKSRYFVDLPGYGYARASKVEHEAMLAMVEDYISFRKLVVCFFLLVDARCGPTDDDLLIANYLQQHSRNFVVVVTKLDKANQSQRHHTSKVIAKLTPRHIMVSARNKQNIARLQTIIDQAFTCC